MNRQTERKLQYIPTVYQTDCREAAEMKRMSGRTIEERDGQNDLVTECVANVTLLEKVSLSLKMDV